VIVNFLVLLNLVSAGGLLGRYTCVVLGFGAGLDTWNTYQYTGEEYERDFQKWQPSAPIETIS